MCGGRCEWASLPKEVKAKTQIDICTSILIALLLTASAERALSVRQWMNECINKKWYIHKVKYYLVLNEGNLLSISEGNLG